ncbi:MAG: phage holin [Mizugakiibacter sp.]|uniref:phage holin n=1 Tax=Mizugakiibacter sp. TaxID=1972610 RepID=UPI00320D645B
MEKTTQAVAYGSAAGSVLAGLTLNDWGVIIGIVVAVMTMLCNIFITIYFKQQSLKLYKARLQAELAGIKGEDDHES